MSPGSVVALFIKPSADAFEPASTLTLVAEKGIEGDYYYGKPSRQVLFLATEDLNAAGFAPGDWREQVTVDFPGLQTLEPGTEVQVGNVKFSVEQDCAPCSHLAQRLGQDPAEFVHRTLRKRGMFLRPKSNGELKVGDSVTVGGA